MDPKPASSLTEWEALGINAGHNLADGHAQHSLTYAQKLGPQELWECFVRSQHEPQTATETRFLSNFFRYSGEPGGVESDTRIHYSSSISIEVVGKILYERGIRKIGLLTPTFDNIPLLLRRSGLDLVGMEESSLDDPVELANWIASVDAVFIVQPNNPTGYVMAHDTWMSLIELCARLNKVYCCDSSFRLFDSRSAWGQYQYLRDLESRQGLNYLLVEDTGKVWPLRELKVGLLSSSSLLREQVRSISDEVMLNVSPFVLNLLSYLMEKQDRTQFLAELARLVTLNRQSLREKLPPEITVDSWPGSKISVEWLSLPSTLSAHHFCLHCASLGVVVLPGKPFRWDLNEGANSNFRVALMRDSEAFDASVRKMLEAYASYSEPGGGS